jgi:tetratricopeptide (TPR) repeat protein
MHLIRIVLATLIGTLLPASPAVAQTSNANDGAAEQYLPAYMMYGAAERSEEAGDLQGAIGKYRRSLEMFDSISKNFPTWEAQRVAYRIGRIKDALARVEMKMNAALVAAAPSMAPAAPMSAPVTAPGAPIVTQPSPVTTRPASDNAGIPSLSDFLKQWEDTVRNRALQLDAQNKQYESDLNKWQEWYEYARKEMSAMQSTKDALAQRSATLEQTVVQMQQEVEAGRAAQSQLDAAKKQLTQTQSEYLAATQKLDATTKQAKDMMDKLGEVSRKLAAMTLDRDNATKAKEDALKLLAESNTARDQALKERDSISASTLGMKTELETLKKNLGNASSKDLLAKNEALRKELDAAKKQIETLKTEVTKKDEEITQLRGQLTSVQTQLTQLRQENATYQTQVSELTLQLKTLQTKMENPGKNDDPQLAAENKMLRDLVLRQLRNQARQQQAKEMVIAELKKTQNASKELLDQVEELGAGRVTLTAEEEKLFSAPELKDALATTGIQATLTASGSGKSDAKSAPATKPAPPSPDNPVAALMDKANAELQENKLDQAAATYDEVLRADPKNTSALIGLGSAKLRSAKFADAEVVLKKCLNFEPDNDAAHFTLGITYFKQDRHREAITSFETSLARNPQNARAHHYLGISSTKLGLLDRAEREFKTALAIDPAYGDAHFNLAVLYITLDPPKWENARGEYQEALKKGVKPDPNLEKILNTSAVKTASAR